MDKGEFREALLAVMERKEHWAWPGFTSGRVPKGLLHIHLEQEYETYVRDFPVLVGRAYVLCPIAEARRELIANVYEEETGGLVAGRPHPELFLEYPRAWAWTSSASRGWSSCPGPVATAPFSMTRPCTGAGPWLQP